MWSYWLYSYLVWWPRPKSSNRPWVGVTIYFFFVLHQDVCENINLLLQMLNISVWRFSSEDSKGKREVLDKVAVSLGPWQALNRHWEMAECEWHIVRMCNEILWSFISMFAFFIFCIKIGVAKETCCFNPSGPFSYEQSKPHQHDHTRRGSRQVLSVFKIEIDILSKWLTFKHFWGFRFAQHEPWMWFEKFWHHVAAASWAIPLA